MVPLKSTEYWWLSSLWGIWNVPMIFFQWSHNNGAPVEMTWFSTQENAKKTCTVPPYQTFSLSLVTAPAFAKLSSGRLESFSPVQQRYAGWLPKEKIKNPFEFMIHDSWCKFPSPNRKYIYIILDIVACLQFAVSYSSCLYKMDQKIQFPKSL